MENKNVGWLLIGISALITIIIFLFSSNAKNYLDATCPYIENGLECPAYNAITNQTYFALVVIGVLVLVGIFLIVSKPKERIVMKKVGNKLKRFDTSQLSSDEKKVFQSVHDSKAIFQAELIEKTGIGKVKMSRILDRLEGQGFIERKRRGMTNIVVLKKDE